jgi:hypothetical protein
MKKRAPEKTVVHGGGKADGVLDQLVDVPIIYLVCITGYIYWLHTSGPHFLRFLQEGGEYRTAVATFAITMVTWHGYGAVQQVMDGMGEAAPWAKYKMHRRDTLS